MFGAILLSFRAFRGPSCLLSLIGREEVLSLHRYRNPKKLVPAKAQRRKNYDKRKEGSITWLGFFAPWRLCGRSHPFTRIQLTFKLPPNPFTLNCPV